MNKKFLVLGIVMLIVGLDLTVGCSKRVYPLDTTVTPACNGVWHKESWNGHVYVCKGQHNGIAHDPDCPCHKDK